MRCEWVSKWFLRGPCSHQNATAINQAESGDFVDQLGFLEMHKIFIVGTYVPLPYSNVNNIQCANQRPAAETLLFH